MYKLYEYITNDVKVGVVISDIEQLLYMGSILHSAKTNVSSNRTKLNSDITGRGLVSVTLDPLTVTIDGEVAQPTNVYEAADKASILQHWNARLSE